MPNITNSYNLTLTLTNGISSPVDITVDVIGNIWVANIGNNTVEKFSSSGQLLQSAAIGVTVIAADVNTIGSLSQHIDCGAVQTVAGAEMLPLAAVIAANSIVRTNPKNAAGAD